MQFIFFPSVTITNLTDIYRWETSLSELLPDFVFEVWKSFLKNKTKYLFGSESLSVMPKLVSDSWTQEIFLSTQVAVPVVSHTPGLQFTLVHCSYSCQPH